MRAGNYGMVGTTAIYNTPLGDTTALRIAIDAQDRDGYVERVDGGTLDSDTHYGGRISLSASPTSWLDNLTVIEGYRYSAEGPYFFPTYVNPTCGPNFTQAICFYNGLTELFFGVPDVQRLFNEAQALGPFTAPAGFAIEPANRFRSWAGSNITDIDVGNVLGDGVGDISLRSIIGYTTDHTRNALDQDGFAPLLINQTSSGESTVWSWEGQVRGQRADNSLNWVIGTFFRDAENTGLGVTQLLIEAGAVNPLIPQSYTGIGSGGSEQAAVYAQATAEVIDNVRLTAGYRVTHIAVDADNYLIQNGECRGTISTTPGAYGPQDTDESTGDVYSCGRRQSTTFNEPSWTVGLDWQVDPDTLLYIVSRRGFNQGGFNGSRDPSHFTYDPEILDDVEIGLKRDWYFGDTQLRTNIALFQNSVHGHSAQPSCL